MHIWLESVVMLQRRIVWKIRQRKMRNRLQGGSEKIFNVFFTFCHCCCPGFYFCILFWIICSAQIYFVLTSAPQICMFSVGHRSVLEYKSIFWNLPRTALLTKKYIIYLVSLHVPLYMSTVKSCLEIVRSFMHSQLFFCFRLKYLVGCLLC